MHMDGEQTHAALSIIGAFAARFRVETAALSCGIRNVAFLAGRCFR
jgi:hypothetical protein